MGVPPPLGTSAAAEARRRPGPRRRWPRRSRTPRPGRWWRSARRPGPAPPPGPAAGWRSAGRWPRSRPPRRRSIGRAARRAGQSTPWKPAAAAVQTNSGHTAGWESEALTTRPPTGGGHGHLGERPGPASRSMASARVPPQSAPANSGTSWTRPIKPTTRSSGSACRPGRTPPPGSAASPSPTPPGRPTAGGSGGAGATG